MCQPVIHENDGMAKPEDDPLGKLLMKLNMLNKGLLVLEWELRLF